YFADETKRRPKQGDVVPLGPIALVAHRVANGRVASIGLRLAEDEAPPATLPAKLKRAARGLWSRLGGGPAPSLPGLTRQSIVMKRFLSMDARVKPAHDQSRATRGLLPE